MPEAPRAPPHYARMAPPTSSLLNRIRKRLERADRTSLRELLVYHEAAPVPLGERWLTNDQVLRLALELLDAHTKGIPDGRRG